MLDSFLKKSKKKVFINMIHMPHADQKTQDKTGTQKVREKRKEKEKPQQERRKNKERNETLRACSFENNMGFEKLLT
jgi:hypothetical protein